MARDIFGISTSRDVKNLEDFMQTGITHIREEHDNIIKHLNELRKTIESIFIFLDKIYENGDITRLKMINENVSFKILKQWQEALDLLRLICLKQDSAQLKDEILGNGQISATLTVNQLRLMIKKGEEKLAHLTFPRDIDLNLPGDQKITLPEVNIEKSKKGNKYTIVIPFIDPKQEIKLYEIQSFPFVTNEGFLRVAEVDRRVGLGKEYYTVIPGLYHMRPHQRNALMQGLELVVSFECAKLLSRLCYEK